MILYHGSNCIIENIDLSKCKPFKDFGQGFYLTTIKQQAREMAAKVAKRFGGEPVLNTYKIDDDFMDKKGLSVKIFYEPNREWAEFVMANRRRDTSEVSAFDVVVGPVANDDIASLFRTYDLKIITIDQLVEGLKYRKLNNQYMFGSEKAIALLLKVVAP